MSLKEMLWPCEFLSVRETGFFLPKCLNSVLTYYCFLGSQSEQKSFANHQFDHRKTLKLSSEKKIILDGLAALGKKGVFNN